MRVVVKGVARVVVQDLDRASGQGVSLATHSPGHGQSARTRQVTTRTRRKFPCVRPKPLLLLASSLSAHIEHIEQIKIEKPTEKHLTHTHTHSHLPVHANAQKKRVIGF